jgi:hypothetical protein
LRADRRFQNQPKHFWANVRSISQHVGYTSRGTGQILVPDLPTIVKALGELAEPVAVWAVTSPIEFLLHRHTVSFERNGHRPAIP